MGVHHIYLHNKSGSNKDFEVHGWNNNRNVTVGPNQVHVFDAPDQSSGAIIALHDGHECEQVEISKDGYGGNDFYDVSYIVGAGGNVTCQHVGENATRKGDPTLMQDAQNCWDHQTDAQTKTKLRGQVFLDNHGKVVRLNAPKNNGDLENWMRKFAHGGYIGIGAWNGYAGNKEDNDQSKGTSGDKDILITWSDNNADPANANGTVPSGPHARFAVVKPRPEAAAHPPSAANGDVHAPAPATNGSTHAPAPATGEKPHAAPPAAAHHEPAHTNGAPAPKPQEPKTEATPSEPKSKSSSETDTDADVDQHFFSVPIAPHHHHRPIFHIMSGAIHAPADEIEASPEHTAPHQLRGHPHARCHPGGPPAPEKEEPQATTGAEHKPCHTKDPEAETAPVNSAKSHEPDAAAASKSHAPTDHNGKATPPAAAKPQETGPTSAPAKSDSKPHDPAANNGHPGPVLHELKGGRSSAGHAAGQIAGSFGKGAVGGAGNYVGGQIAQAIGQAISNRIHGRFVVSASHEVSEMAAAPSTEPAAVPSESTTQDPKAAGSDDDSSVVHVHVHVHEFKGGRSSAGHAAGQAAGSFAKGAAGGAGNYVGGQVAQAIGQDIAKHLHGRYEVAPPHETETTAVPSESDSQPLESGETNGGSATATSELESSEPAATNGTAGPSHVHENFRIPSAVWKVGGGLAKQGGEYAAQQIAQHIHFGQRHFVVHPPAHAPAPKPAPHYEAPHPNGPAASGPGIHLTNNAKHAQDFYFYDNFWNGNGTAGANFSHPLKNITVQPNATEWVSLPASFKGRVQRGTEIPATWAEFQLDASNDHGAHGDISVEQGCDGAAEIASTDGSNRKGGFTQDLVSGAPESICQYKAGHVKAIKSTMGNWLGGRSQEAIDYLHKRIGSSNAYVEGGTGVPDIASRNQQLAVTFY